MISFIRHPDIALNAAEWATGRFKTWYSNDYLAGFSKVAAREWSERDLLRSLFANDLWFLLCYGFGISVANHPFVVKMCREVQAGPRTDTLDIWARFHFKDLDKRTPVLTEKGWTEHGRLKIGDRVFSPSGKLVKVIGTNHFTSSECYRIKFDNGSEITCGAGHLWKVEIPSRKRVPGTKNKRVPRETKILETSELYRLKPCYRPVILTTEPLQYPKRDLPIDPYVLGVWLGDGSSGSNTFCGVDKDIFAEVERRGYELSHNHCPQKEPLRMSAIYGIRPSLRLLDVLGNKHIPDIYFTSSEEQRRELLQGLIDTDGYVSRVNGCVTFSQTNLRLSEQVRYLANSLGFKARLTPVRSTNSWQVTFQATRDERPCLLARKFNILPERKRRISSRGWRIYSIEKVITIPTNCIKVNSEDGMYLVGKELIPTHNTLIITQAETFQFQMKNPDKCTGIFCYARPAAKKPLRSLKVLMEESELLQWCFPEVLWKRPEVEAPKWSEDDGLILKRAGSSRKESSIEAHGLIEGMPTGSHFERNVFDDLETDDIRESPDMLAKVYSKFQMASVNMGTGADTDQTRVIGTYYSYFGPNVKVRDMRYADGRPVYHLRLIPGSADGTRDGAPILMDEKSWEKAKMSPHFNSQQLCDPTPSSEIRLNGSYLKPIEPEFIPRTVFKFMVLDQAGGDETEKQSRDLWSYGVLGIEPVLDDIGQSNVYLLDVEADKMSHSEGIDGIVRMYTRNGIIHQMGVEKVGLSTTEIHISNALRMQGRRLSLDAGNLVLLKPAGRSKSFRVETALQWPLNNGKLFYSTAIPRKYIDAIVEEMQKFPFFHVDILDMWAYAYDLFKEYRFPVRRTEAPKVESPVSPLLFGLRGADLRSGMRVAL